MANPRMVHEFEELFIRRATMAGDETLPFERDQPYGTSHRHAPVKFTGHKTVGLCLADDVPFGSLERVEADGSVVVAWLGSVLYAGSASAGSAVVGDGAGGVKNATGAGRGIAGSSEGGRVVVFQ